MIVASLVRRVESVARRADLLGRHVRARHPRNAPAGQDCRRTGLSDSIHGVEAPHERSLSLYTIVESDEAVPDFSGNPGRRDGLGPQNPDDPVAGLQRRGQEIPKLRAVPRGPQGGVSG
jgi:hypothetical protein